MPTYLFLDTMTLLHFKTPSDIPWESLVQGKPVEVLISRTVIYELDKHKSQHPSQKIRERARRVLKQIETWASAREPQEIRTGVVVRVHQDLPRRDLAELHLNPAWADDLLIATALEFTPSEADAVVMLVTDDTGARIKARQLGIACLELSDDLRLPVERDPLVVENERLRQEQIRLATRPIPVLALQFSDGRTVAKFSTPARFDEPRVTSECNEQIEILGAKVRPLDGPTPEMMFLGISEKEIERFNREVGEYPGLLAAYRDRLVAHRRKADLTFQFELQLANTGRAPAADIDVWVHFPSGFELVTAKRLSPAPRPPRHPSPPRSPMQVHIDQFRQAFAYPASPYLDQLGSRPNVSVPRIKETESCVLEQDVLRLKHGNRVSLGRYAIVFGAIEDVRPFEVDFRINAEDMPDDVDGKLRFAFAVNPDET